MAYVRKRGFMACETAVSQGGAHYIPSKRDRAEQPRLARRIWKGRKGDTLPELLGHGTGVKQALAIACEGKVHASPCGKTGQGHYSFAIKKIIDDKGRYDFKATLRQAWKRGETRPYFRDLAEFSE